MYFVLFLLVSCVLPSLAYFPTVRTLKTYSCRTHKLFTAQDASVIECKQIDQVTSLPKTIANQFLNGSKIIWDFSRPHTILGSGLSIVFLYLFAVPPTLWNSAAFKKSLIMSLVPSLFMNIYITGLNQVTDVEIDKINKPYLPIAAGDLSKSNGIAIVITSLLVSIYFTINTNWPLATTVIGSGILGTIYSLPPFRLKRFPLLAAFCILTVRGLLVNLGYFLQAKIQVLGLTVPNAIVALRRFPESIYLTVFFAIFGTVIALLKDVPDIKGFSVLFANKIYIQHIIIII
jgi:homogentisate phytyltransferase/homogentisate geranylgeranyltransferase